MNWVGITFSGFFAVTAIGSEAVKPDKLEVVIVDYAGRPHSQLSEARWIGARLLAEAGVRSTWKVCGPAAERTGGSGCFVVGPLTVVVRLLPPRLATAWKISGSMCGLALTGNPGERGRLALIDMACIDRTAAPSEQSKAAVLAHIITHEVGHLLLGRGSHTVSGLMAAWWTSSQLRLVQRGDLHFSEEEAGQLQEAVQRRGIAAAGETVAMIPRSER